MNEPPGASARVALSGLTIAEYFRDGDGTGKGKDILFFVDNIFRFTQAGSEVSALLRPYAFCGGLPANACYRNGFDAGKNYFYKKWFYYFCAGGLCTCR
ncbi:MAG: hypothetical protein WKF59_05595 [Chitinophagaceae bacterium]